MKLFFAAPLSGLPSDPTALARKLRACISQEKQFAQLPRARGRLFRSPCPRTFRAPAPLPNRLQTPLTKPPASAVPYLLSLASAYSPSSLLWERDDWLSCHDRSIGNASVKGAALDRIVLVARSQLRRLAGENRDVALAVAIEIFHAPRVLKFEVSREGEVTAFVRSELFGHLILNAFFLVQFRGMITARVKREFPLFFHRTFAMSLA